MDSTRISIARILEADVPLTWQEAVAVVHEVAMVSDVEAAMTGSPPLVTSATCFLTAAGDVDLPETAANETPGAVADLLQAVLRGREAPAALLALARRRPDDLFGELAAFSSGPRRPVIAALAARARSAAPVADVPVDPPRRLTPAAPTPPTESGPRRWAPMVPTGAASPPTVVNLLTQPTVAPSPTPPVAAAWPPAAAVPPPPQRAPEPAAAPVAPASTLASTPASTPPRPRPPAPVPVVPAVGLTPQGVVAAELQRLRLKTAQAGARLERSRFTPSPRRAGWIAGGTLAAGVLAALLWTARSDTPALLEATYPGPRAMWPFAASIAPVSPVASPTGPTRSGPTPPMLPRLQDRSTAASNVLSPMTTASPREPNASANVVEAPLRARMSSGGVVPAPSGPGEAPRGDLAPKAPAPAPPATAAPPPATDAPSLVASTTTERRATAVGAARGRGFSKETFSAGDADVAPPDLRRQQLPTAILEPGTPVPEGWPYLTLVVDETGAVESVRLTASTPAPGQSLYRHRMLLAAVKAWQFKPARKNGQPVRYAIRVPLEP